jgi:hypothetical protein
MPDKTNSLLTVAQRRQLRRALDALNGLADSLGERWDDEEFDQLASARSNIREWDGWVRDVGAA